MGREKKSLTFDNANRVAILIRPPVLLGMASIAQDPDGFLLIRCDLKAVPSHWCWVPCPWLDLQANSNNHYVLNIYYVPDIILFLMHHLN